MAVTITVEQAKDGFETTVSDVEIQELIDFVSATADLCLDANLITDNKIVLMKKYAVRHACTLMAESGRGTIKSQGSPSGSRSFNSWIGKGIDATTYGVMLNQIDITKCVTVVFNNDNNLGLFVIGSI
jgi:hypothetical protein